MQLDAAVADYVTRGWAVESRTENQAVMAKKSYIGWFWNTILALITGGLWLIVVAFRVINRKIYRVVLTYDGQGVIVRP